MLSLLSVNNGFVPLTKAVAPKVNPQMKAASAEFAFGLPGSANM